METIAAIDIGSNAIRLLLGEVDGYGDIRVIKKYREPVRLGKDTFAQGEISPRTLERAAEAFKKFNDLLVSHGVRKFMAVGTSALREARNQEHFVREIKRISNIPIRVIDGIEESRLIFSAVANRVDLSDKAVLLIDIGGGSVELTIAVNGDPVASETFKLGTVRLLQMLDAKKLSENQLSRVITEQLGPVRAFLSPHQRRVPLEAAIGTGGNFECLGKLRVALLHKNSIFSMNRSELGDILSQLQAMGLQKRIEDLRLRPDRADVIVPAAILTHSIMNLAQLNILMVPFVGLREGILSSLLPPNSKKRG